jgi:hypothetical protein
MNWIKPLSTKLSKEIKAHIKMNKYLNEQIFKRSGISEKPIKTWKCCELSDEAMRNGKCWCKN